jgi:hypothetical protein
MRPDDVRVGADEPTEGYDIPIAAELQPLDAELSESGIRARHMLHGRTQPTNYFAMDLRARLLGTYSGDEAAGSATLDVTAPRGQSPAPTPAPRSQPQPRRTQPSVMASVAPRIEVGVPSILLNVRLALVAAAVATGLLIAGALGTGVIPR